MLVGWVYEVSEPVVDKLLCEGACLHIGVHVYLRDIESGIVKHGAYRDDVWMDLSP